jgi:colanic acid/amylovoran biosynthesis glycosyltransferase
LAKAKYDAARDAGVHDLLWQAERDVRTSRPIQTPHHHAQAEGRGVQSHVSTTLAVFTSQLGTVSETFIRRHVEDLLPGRTVAVARHSRPPLGGRWEAPCPVLFLDRWALGLPVRLARRAGVPEARLRDAAVERFLRRHNVGVVLGEYLDQFVDFVPLLDRMGIPYVVQGHGIDLSAALRKPALAQRYQAYKSARAILTRCEFHRRRLIALGLPANKIEVNPGGIDIPAAAIERGAEAAKRFLAIGRMTAKKGPIYLLEAFRLAGANDPDITLDYIGDGELLPAVRQFVDATALGARVRLHGAASEETKHHLLRECGVFVQHSLTDPDTGDEEGLPAGIQEAMAHGMAVVSTRHSGIGEAVEEGITGSLVEEGDSAGMAQAMLRMSSQEESYLRLGRAARAKAERLYSWPAERLRVLKHLHVAS